MYRCCGNYRADVVRLHLLQMSDDKKRTLRQNRALHLYFTMVADELNDAGLDMKKVLNPGIDIPWNGASVKHFLWRAIQRVQIQKKSTTELTTKEIDIVFDTLNRHLGEKLGIHTPFPSIEEIMIQMQIKK